MIAVSRRFVSVFAALVISASAARGHSVSGSIAGTVVDQTRQVLPGATVTLVNEETADRRVTTSSDIGAFVFPAVKPGTYTIRIELTGFTDPQSVQRAFASGFDAHLGKPLEPHVLADALIKVLRKRRN